MPILEMKVPSPGESITEVEIAEWMIKDYPNEMTIVIQNWFRIRIEI